MIAVHLVVSHMVMAEDMVAGVAIAEVEEVTVVVTTANPASATLSKEASAIVDQAVAFPMKVGAVEVEASVEVLTTN